MVNIGEVLTKFDTMSHTNFSEADKISVVEGVIKSLYADLKNEEAPSVTASSGLVFGEGKLLIDALMCEDAKVFGDSVEYENYRNSFDNRYKEIVKNYLRTHEPKKAQFFN